MCNYSIDSIPKERVEEYPLPRLVCPICGDDRLLDMPDFLCPTCYGFPIEHEDDIDFYEESLI